MCIICCVVRVISVTVLLSYESLDGLLCVLDSCGQLSSLSYTPESRSFADTINLTHLGLLEVMNLVELDFEHGNEFALVRIVPYMRCSTGLENGKD